MKGVDKIMYPRALNLQKTASPVMHILLGGLH